MLCLKPIMCGGMMLCNKQNEQLPTQIEKNSKQMYGWYSESMENITRQYKTEFNDSDKSCCHTFSAFLYGTPDGKEIKVTLVNRDPNNSGYGENVQDVKFCGPVTHLIKQIP